MEIPNVNILNMDLIMKHTYKIRQYNNYIGMVDTMSRLRKDEAHQAFQKEIGSMLRSRSNEVVLEFATWCFRFLFISGSHWLQRKLFLMAFTSYVPIG